MILLWRLQLVAIGGTARNHYFDLEQTRQN